MFYSRRGKIEASKYWEIEFLSRGREEKKGKINKIIQNQIKVVHSKKPRHSKYRQGKINYILKMLKMREKETSKCMYVTEPISTARIHTDVHAGKEKKKFLMKNQGSFTTMVVSIKVQQSFFSIL